MKVHIADSPYWKNIGSKFQKEYAERIDAAFKDALELLPFASEHMNFFVQPKDYGLIKETDTHAYTHNSELISIGFNPAFKLGKEKILETVRPTVFHEMSHAARFNIPIWHKNILDSAIMEGLATVFERDYAPAKPLWGKYLPLRTYKWVKELAALQGYDRNSDYMYDHPDGRRWIGYKTGTYIVDEAIKHSGHDVIELTRMECKEILRFAQVL